MKKIFPVLSVLLLMAFSLSAEKYALIVAIGDYPDPGKNGWGKISSANDLPLIKTALEKQGFKTDNILTLQDSAATKDGIKNAFDKLISKVNAGDIVVVHFSSHGEQIEDDNKDETDNLDESIVPYGAVYTYDKSKFKEYAPGYFRDDEFGEKVTLLRNKLTGKGDLLVLLDACHSGTGTRGVSELIPRGAKEPMVSDNFDLSITPVADVNGVFKDGGEKSKVKLSNDAATYVVISGAQAKEFNYECYDDNGNPVGSLSYAFSKTVAQLKDKTSYRGLFAQIENVMRDKAPRQKPVLEGDGIDRSLFGGDFISQKHYFTIKKWRNDGEFVLDAGSVSGITKGSVLSVYPAGTADPAGKVALNKGIVQSVSNFESVVKLDRDDTLYKVSPWVFVTEMNYGDKLKVDVRNINDSQKKIQDAFKDFGLVEFSKACDIYLDTLGSTRNWALKYPTTAAVFDGGFTLEKTDDIKNALKRFARYRYLQGLDFTEEGLEAEVSLVFLKADGQIDNAKINSRTVNGRLELIDGDVVHLKIINKGGKKLFINIVDIQPDGKINPILPKKSEDIFPDDCEIAGHDTVLLKDYKITIGLPEGEEIFKVFLSKDKLDLEDILTKRDDRASRGVGGALNNMAKVFAESDGDAISTRGATGTVNTNQNGSIFNLNFTIKSK